VVGLGTWQQFDVDLARTGGDELARVLRVLVEEGGGVVDASPMYGRAEEVVGALAERTGLESTLFYATKVWTRGREEGIREMERSFRRMGVETMDLMQVHNLLDLETHLPVLREWKAEGRIRYLGVTHYRVDAFDRLEELIRTEELDFVQLNFNMAVPDAEERLLPLAGDRGVAVLVNRPYEGGNLFRRVRGRNLPPWAAELGCESWGQFFLKWILGQPDVTCVIPGTSDPEHMRDNAGAGHGPLPDDAARRRMTSHLESL
jgi:diketogulonate reductase-like aldo/keto reductase